MSKAGTLILFALIIAWATNNRKEWEKFVQQNHCHKTIDMNHGNKELAGYSEGWLCADGVTYYH